mmetsp:Transcript_8020/g.20571  ORF Transcript_8020/g.20571 Transcript_8020/m.20571 type:complete len:223 (-) Transcript_8020:751-1419(-)
MRSLSSTQVPGAGVVRFSSGGANGHCSMSHMYHGSGPGPPWRHTSLSWQVADVDVTGLHPAVIGRSGFRDTLSRASDSSCTPSARANSVLFAHTSFRWYQAVSDSEHTLELTTKLASTKVEMASSASAQFSGFEPIMSTSPKAAHEALASVRSHPVVASTLYAPHAATKKTLVALGYWGSDTNSVTVVKTEGLNRVSTKINLSRSSSICGHPCVRTRWLMLS